jgi:hypothetical protein
LAYDQMPTRLANAEYRARHRDQTGPPDQAGPPDQPPASTTAPQDVPWTPTTTEIDIIAAIRGLCQKHAPTGNR